MNGKIVVTAIAVIAAVAVCAGGAAVLFNEVFGSGNYAKISLDGDSGVESVSGLGNYRIDSTATVKAVLREGYDFDGWYDGDGNLVSADNPYSFKVKNGLSLSARTISAGEVKVYHMNGISKITKTSEDLAAGTVTITAEVEKGTTFTGWYSFSGTELSTAATYTLEKKYLNSVVAKTDSTEYTGVEKFSYTLNQDVDADSVIWIITDWRTGEFVDSFTKTTSINTTVHPGKYDLRVVATKTNGQSLDSTQHEVITGEVQKTFTWKYKGVTHSAVWTTDYKNYDNYQNSNVKRAPTTYSDRLSFINYTSNTVSIFADYLTEHSAGMTDIQRANYVLAFVQQCITYQHDDEFCGKTEYWKYPYETLYDMRGDCEDSSILYCALMKSMGYDSALILFVGEEYVGRGHAAAGISVDGASGSYYAKEGKNFYYCETTAEGWTVGKAPEGYKSAYVYVVGSS